MVCCCLRLLGLRSGIKDGGVEREEEPVGRDCKIPMIPEFGISCVIRTGLGKAYLYPYLYIPSQPQRSPHQTLILFQLTPSFSPFWPRMRRVRRP